MNTLNHLKGNFLIGGVGVGLGYLSKKILKTEILPVSSGKQMALSFSGIVLATIVGKTIMYNLAKNQKLGFDKVENEGFIGLLPADGFPFVPKNPNNLSP